MSMTWEANQGLSLTIVIEEQREEFCPPIPFEYGIGLSQEFTGMN